MEYDALRERYAPDRSGNVSGNDFGTAPWFTDCWYVSSQMNQSGSPPQPGIVPPQNTQGPPTWIPGTQQNPSLGFSGQSSPPPGVQPAMGGHMSIQQHNFPQVSQQNPGNSMTPPQPQPSQGNILAPPSTLQNFTGSSVPPLDRLRFQGSYRHFCSTKKLQINEAALNIGG